MRILAAILLLTATAFGQEGLDTAIGKGSLPDGIAGVTDIKKVQLLRVEALKNSMQILNDQVQTGRVSLGQLSELYSESHMELALARLDASDDKQERLDIIQEALNGAIRFWRIANDRRSVAAEGSGTLSETRAKADVYKLRVMWLKEKARSES